MNLSQLATGIKESPTLTLNAKARALREQGEPVIHLGAGEPKSVVPADAIIGAAAKLTTGEIRYTPTKGIPKLVQAVIRYTAENYDYEPKPENVLTHSGAKQAIYSLMMSILNPQDEVIILSPYWVSYPEIIKMVYGIPVVVDPPAGRFEPRFEDIVAKVGRYTKAIMINSPNNPSGVVYSADLIGELVEYCIKNDIYLITDDIYHKLVFDGVKAPLVYDFDKNPSEDSPIIVVNGVSKAYAMTGFRIGWTIANKEVTRVMTNVAAQNTSCPSIVQQAAAVGALNGVQNGVESLRLTLENGRNVMMDELAGIDGIKCNRPQGTFYCLPDFRAFSNDSTELSQFLLEKALVVTVPGVEFGMEGHLRLSYCGAIEDIVEAVARIRWALDPNSPEEIYLGDRKVRRDWQ
jgi:aspartate aminotransferase